MDKFTDLYQLNSFLGGDQTKDIYKVTDLANGDVFTAIIYVEEDISFDIPPLFSSLKNHPNVISHVNHGFFEVLGKQRFVVLTQYQPGILLADFIEHTKGNIDPEKWKFIARGLFDGLIFIHDVCDFAHGSLTPWKIILRADDLPMIQVDYSTWRSDYSMKSGEAEETEDFLYYSPERMEGEGTEPSFETLKQSDVWAIGLILYNLASGLYSRWQNPSDISDTKIDLAFAEVFYSKFYQDFELDVKKISKPDKQLEFIITACVIEQDQRSTAAEVFSNYLSKFKTTSPFVFEDEYQRTKESNFSALHARVCSAKRLGTKHLTYTARFLDSCQSKDTLPGELRIAEMLSKRMHTNILNYQGAQRYASRIYSSIQRVFFHDDFDGFSLHENNITGLTEQKWLSMVRGAFNGLYFLHRLGIAHRNINPSNVLVTNNTGKIVLTGLERACPRTATDCTKKGFKESKFYHSPELAACLLDGSCKNDFVRISKPNDVWAMGLVLFGIFTNHSFPWFTVDSARYHMELSSAGFYDNYVYPFFSKLQKDRYPPSVINIAIDCLYADRKSARQIVEITEDWIKKT